jgi:hypothetical protein
MSQAHVAASITYEETPRPKGLPDELQPLTDVTLRFLSISAIDGFKIAAAVSISPVQPIAAHTTGRTLGGQISRLSTPRRVVTLRAEGADRP